MSTRMKGINPYDKVYDGVYRAIVEALPGSDGDDHPELGRVRVRIPSIHGEVEDVQLLPWARPCTLGAFSGDSRGTFNLPDLGDIIWVMFEAGNYQYPVYLGGTTSSHSLSAETVMENKGEKSTAVTLYTENGNMIQYTRKDGSECYTITLEDKSITVDKTGIHIQGDTDITGNLTVNGDLNVSGSGSIGSELSVGGELKVANKSYFDADIHVDGIVFCHNVVTSYGDGLVGTLDVLGYDVDGLSEVELDDLFESLGLASSDYLSIANLFLGMEESNDKSDALVQFLGRNLVGGQNAWCALFVSKCLQKAGVNVGLNSESVAGLISQAKNLHIFAPAGSSYQPAVGDIVCMKGANISHTGFITGINADGSYQIIAGNTGDKVKSYSITRSQLGESGGFISMGVK